MADRSERSGNSTGLSGINGHRGWQIAAGALVLATIGIIISLFTPMRTGAWPWDDDRDVAVRGELGCQTYDLDAPWGMPHVESFTIRGRDNVWNNDNPLSPTYAVTIPVGWKVEWEMTCSGDKPRSGSFTVGKPAALRSTQQLGLIPAQRGMVDPPHMGQPRHRHSDIDGSLTDGVDELLDPPHPFRVASQLLEDGTRARKLVAEDDDELRITDGT